MDMYIYIFIHYKGFTNIVDLLLSSFINPAQ